MMTTPKPNRRLAAATVLCAVLAGTVACKRDAADATPSAPSPAAVPAADAATAPDAHATDVISEVDNAPGPADIDARAFAGTFTGTLPCADCPGIDATLELKADGRYALSETYRERNGGPFPGDGTWTAEAHGKQLRLDPNSKDDRDRVYAIVDNDTLQSLDGDGRPLPGSLDAVLRRSQPGR